MMRWQQWMGLGLSGLFLSGVATAWQPDAIQAKRLSNGLQVLVSVNPSSKAAFFQIWYHVGSVDEPLGETGVSHFLEHLMFRGTQVLSDGAFDQEIAAVGGVDNAFTSTEVTAYFDNLAVDHLPLAFQLEADRMQHLSFSTEIFNKEKAVILEERRMRIADNPFAGLLERYNAVANIATPLANPTIGWESDIEQLRTDQVSSWYNTWYQPNNTTIVVVGNVDPDKVFALADQYFGHMNTVATPTRPNFPGLNNAGEREVLLSLPAQLPALIMGFQVPSLVTAKDPSTAYALYVLGQLLAGGDSSMMAKALIRQSGLATQINVNNSIVSRLNSSWMLTAIPNQNVAPQDLETAMWQVIDSIKRNPVSASDLNRVKREIYANRIYELDDPQNVAYQLGLLDSVGLSYQLVNSYLDSINQITPEQLQAVAKQYLVPQNMTVAVLKPSSHSLGEPLAALPTVQVSSVSSMEKVV
ncbi:MAG: insulinase family protein [Gammaproteobacteria bacterium]|nr:insulinase family protein [Gammaproteobacteria bacterium]